jgi:hypothetical protein
MSDPFREPAGTNPPRHLQPEGDTRAVGWTLGTVAVVALFTVSWWAWSERAPMPADPPAVTAAPAPAPATGVPAPEPETTTGQAPAPAR